VTFYEVAFDWAMIDDKPSSVSGRERPMMNEDRVSATLVSQNFASQCVICGTPLDGLPSYLFRVFGINRSTRNPNVCNRCNGHVEEGRIVEITVLFADLSSFTELTHKLGPERAHEVADAFLKMAAEVVVKHDGVVDKYIGDGAMALFNVPIRRGDHAAQAVVAAMDIQAQLPRLGERFGLDLQARVGIASGWARIGRLGSMDVKDYTVIGNVVNLASRLEGQARSGEVLLYRNVYQQVADEFPGVPAESLAVKGFPGPIKAYRLRTMGGLPQPGPAQTGSVKPAHSQSLGLGAVVFALLGAPCAALTLIGPWAATLGIAGLFGATSSYWILDDTPVRLPLLLLATLGSMANLYTVWHARELRRKARTEGRILPMTRLERRRTILVVSVAVASLALVGFELYTHATFHESWY